MSGPSEAGPTRTGESAFLIHPILPAAAREARAGGSARAARLTDEHLEEARGLIRAIDLTLSGEKILKLSDISPGHLLGKGAREALTAEIEAVEPSVVVVNASLSPGQQRNLERLWKVKVIDRTGLILEIFGARAQTREGRIQVDLAALSYQRSRLVRSWTHLERQRGGAGFMGGPGETQLELDRRSIDDRIIRLKKDLEDVRRTRDLQRKARARVPYPIIALVGYTNAGKSTLFNTLTGANVFAKDLPFATLDPTMRRIELPNGQSAILSDTVGFISDLPTHLVAAFRATLEQVEYADVIVHVRDVSNPDHPARLDDVKDVLEQLGIAYDSDSRIIEALNKTDLLDPDTLADTRREAKFDPRKVVISALSGEGTPELLKKVTELVGKQRQRVRFELPVADGQAIAWLHAHAHVLSRRDQEDTLSLTVELDPADLGRFVERFAYQPFAASEPEPPPA